MRLHNKLIIVTGGGSGMGRSLVLGLLNKDARVVAIDLNQYALDETAELSGNKKDLLTTLQLDITSKADVENNIEKIIAQLGPVDGIVNNAGIIQPFIHLRDLPFSSIEKVMNVNFWGMLYLIKSLLPHLLTRPEAHIINISSMGGFFPFPGQTIYGASKAAVKIMSEGMMQELRDTNVHVSVVFPGAVKTNIITNSGLKNNTDKADDAKTNRMLLSAEKAAEIIIKGIEKNKMRIFVGRDSKLMDLIYRLSPKMALRFIAKKMQKK